MTLLALCPALAAAADSEFKPFTAGYSISTHGLAAGNARLQLQRTPDGRWSYSSETVARGLFRLLKPDLSARSVFRIQDDQLIPESFTSGDGNSTDDDDQNFAFDWSAGRVRGTAAGKRVDLATQPGLLDSLSVQVALMHELLAGHMPDHFALLDKDHIKDYSYTAQGKERVKTDVGTYDTVIFRSSRQGSSKTTWFWCAAELGYLPLKVERRDGKDVQFAMQLTSVQR